MANFYIYAPDIHEGDAVGNHSISIYKLANRLGFDTRIFANQFSGSYEVQKWDNLNNENYTSDDFLFINYSIFDPHIENALNKKLKKIVYYHNITPPNILIDSNPRTAELCKNGIEDLILLEKADMVIVNSVKTKNDLSKCIKKNIYVVPPISSDMLFYKNLNQTLSSIETGLTLNFTGRIEPNKNIEQLIEIMTHLVSFNSEYKLVIVGKAENLNYLDTLIGIVDKNQIAQAITFKGFISLSDLINEYNRSDAFITTSLHEGFCVPVHEMMSMGKASFIKKGGNAAEEFIYAPENTLLGENNYENAVKINRNLPRLLKDKEAIKKKSIEILNLTSDNNWKDLLNKI